MVDYFSSSFFFFNFSSSYNWKYFGHLMQGADSLENTLMLGKIEGRRKRGWQRWHLMASHQMVRRQHWLNGHEFEQALGGGEGQGSLACCSPWGSQRVRHDWVTEHQGFWIITRSKERGINQALSIVISISLKQLNN